MHAQRKTIEEARYAHSGYFWKCLLFDDLRIMYSVYDVSDCHHIRAQSHDMNFNKQNEPRIKTKCREQSD